MERKTWVKPMTLVQKFEANETVAATQCWYINCEWSGVQHIACRRRDSYQYLDENNNDKIDKVMFDDMIGPGNVWYVCEFYTDSSESSYIDIETLDPKPGNVVYWKTGATNHKSTVHAVDSSHPNRS